MVSYEKYRFNIHDLFSNFIFTTLNIMIVTGACDVVNARVIALEFEFSSEKWPK